MTILSIDAATRHGIWENDRVQKFVHFLLGEAPLLGELWSGRGALMYVSHSSNSRIGLGSEETDLLVMFGTRSRAGQRHLRS